MPPTVTAISGRKFSCFPAAVLVIVVNAQDEVLLFSTETDDWTVIAGAIDANETIRDAAYRELREEAGSDLSARAIGVVHAHTFHYDDVVRNLISIYYVLRYEEGDVFPGDDMSGAIYRWWPLADLRDAPERLAVPKHQVWLLERAVEMARTFEDQEASLEYFVDGDV